jgi:probable rRNA maturation factor
MIVHGVLHLLGFDHINDNDAQQMEAMEIRILEQLGFCNPYEEINHL